MLLQETYIYVNIIKKAFTNQYKNLNHIWALKKYTQNIVQKNNFFLKKLLFTRVSFEKKI